MQAIMPGGGSFHTKYGVQDSRQILVQIFDYIRCTNLYDAYLDEEYVKLSQGRPYLDDNSPAAPGATALTGNALQQDIALWEKTPAQFSYYTYTAPRFDTARREGDLVDRAPPEFRSQFNKGTAEERVTVGAFPGHGQVRPIEWQMEGTTYKGFGRFPAISEVALQFICTGDGYTGTNDNPDPGAYAINNNGQIIRSGGKTAQRIDPSKPWDDTASRQPLLLNGRPSFWYSNIPPFPSRKTFESWGCVFGIDPRDPKHPSNHPGWNPLNWNCTLDSDPVNGGIPRRRMRSGCRPPSSLSFSCPRWVTTRIAPDFTIVLDGTVFSRSSGAGRQRRMALAVQHHERSGRPIRPAYSGSRLGENVGPGNVSPMGGSYGSQPLMAGRQAKAIGRMPRDPELHGRRDHQHPWSDAELPADQQSVHGETRPERPHQIPCAFQRHQSRHHTPRMTGRPRRQEECHAGAERDDQDSRCRRCRRRRRFPLHPGAGASVVSLRRPP